MVKANEWYTAKINNYGIMVKEGKSPLFWIEFNIPNENGVTAVSWRGMVSSDKAKNRTLKTLVTCGLKGNDVNRVGEGKLGGALNTDVDYRVKVEENTYNGKTFMNVGLVSLSTPKKFQQALDKKTAHDLTAELMAVRKQMGEKGDWEPGF